MRWDDITILRAVDQHQDRFGGGEVWGVDGRPLMDEVAGSQVTDDGLVRGFLRELENLEREGYLTFTVYDRSPNNRTAYPYIYLQQIRDFALTIKGRDRALGIQIVQPLPNPDEDDGRPIPALVLEQIAYAIAEEYTPQQIPVFLDEAAIPLDRLPFPEQTPDVRGDPGGFVCGVLIGLDQWGSEGRRTLRSFVGAWLDDRFISGPTDELRTELVEKLARRGWYVVDGDLVIGDPAKGKRVRSPVLRDARLAALHPDVLAVSEQLFRDGHRAAAVFEASKALNNRVKKMANLNSDGMGLMSSAFKDDQPALVLADLAPQTGKDIQSGYRFLFMGRSRPFATRPPTSSSASWTTTRPSSCSVWPVS